MPGRGLALCLLLAALLVACGGGSSGGQQKVVGVIITVDAPSLTVLNSFTLRDQHGQMLTFHIAPDAARDPQEGFVAGHLRSHALAAEKVRVTYRTQGDELLAEKLEHCNTALPPC
jgi:hypothetical protein